MKIHIKYFAALREQTGKSEETIETNLKSAEQIYEELKKKYHLTLTRDNLQLAVNDSYVSFETQLNDSDILVFIPPVAGG